MFIVVCSWVVCLDFELVVGIVSYKVFVVGWFWVGVVVDDVVGCGGRCLRNWVGI